MTQRSAPVVLVCALLVLLAGCRGEEQSVVPSASLLPQNPTELPTMDPTTFAALIAQQRGTPVLVNFWGSWCPPCKEETPDLVAAHRRWGDSVRFIGVDLSDNRDGATSFIDEFGVPYPSVFDPSNQIAVSYGLFSPPATLFFDENGTLVETVPGQISAQDLESNIESIAP
jgi:thiol:disulfide interchange protein